MNDLLDRSTADALGIPVMAGPVEAAAIGNLAVLATAGWTPGDIERAGEAIGNSFDIRTYEPRDSASWDAALEKYINVTGGGPLARQ